MTTNDSVSPPADAHRTPTGDGSSRLREVEELGEQIARLSAHIQAATYRLLVMIRAFGEAEGWHHQGFASCAAWLSWRTGIGRGAAREKVRVARALADLPELSDALRTGELSYSVARALTRVATPENETELVEVARHSTAAQMERLVSAWRATDRAADAGEAEPGRHRGRELSVAVDPPDGSYVVRGRLDPEAGAALERALEAAEDELYGSEGEAAAAEADADCPCAARRADALGRVAEAALAEGLGEPARTAERYQVVVHVSAETLRGTRAGEPSEGDASAETPEGSPPDGGEPPRLEGGPRLSAETARRLGCDASVVGILEDAGGRPLDVGRKRRSVPAPIRRALESRDGGRCRWPGCGSRFTEAHHVVPWAEGGATSLENLLLLCRRHHRRVHEGGWTVERDAEGELAVVRPDGRELPELPPRAPPPDFPLCRLEEEHEELGVEVWTGLPRWMGDAMDVDWALWVLRDQHEFPLAEAATEGTEPGNRVSAETADRSVRRSPG